MLARLNVQAGAEIERPPEIDLIRRSQAGDRQAFAELYDLHVDRVYRHIFYRVGSKGESEDLTQQTFMKAWQSIARYQITTVPFVAWLLTIAHNGVVSYFRSKRDHHPLDELVARVDERENPDSALLRQYHQTAVRQAIGQLKPEQQQVVTMRYLEELDYRDIARAMNKTEGNVRVILHRALQAMRRSLVDL